MWCKKEVYKGATNKHAKVIGTAATLLSVWIVILGFVLQILWVSVIGSVCFNIISDSKDYGTLSAKTDGDRIALRFLYWFLTSVLILVTLILEIVG